MYSHVITFIIAILIYTTFQPRPEPVLYPSMAIGLLGAVFILFAALTHARFARFRLKGMSGSGLSPRPSL